METRADTSLATTRRPFLKRLFRLVFPRVVDPILDAPLQRLDVDSLIEDQYLSLIDRSDPFREARYREGIRWRGVLNHFVPAPARVLDLGAGDGAIELALNAGGYITTS